MPALQADFADCTHTEMLVFADSIDIDDSPRMVRRVSEELAVRVVLRLRGHDKEQCQPFDQYWMIEY